MSDRPIAEIFAELAAHPDFLLGSYLTRQHLEDAGIDADRLDADGQLDEMGAALESEAWNIVRVRDDEINAGLRRIDETVGEDPGSVLAQAQHIQRQASEMPGDPFPPLHPKPETTDDAAD